MASASESVNIDGRRALQQIEIKLGEALTADETGKIGDALTKYIEIETDVRRLATRLGPSDEKIKERLNAYLANIMSRKEILSQNLDAVLPAVPSAPPAYSEIPPPPPPPRSLSRPPPLESAPVLLSLPTAQLYAVSQEGQVSALSIPSSLAVRQLDNGAPFLQVGEWTCPLIAGETPALITGEGWNTLMVPDPVSIRSNDSVAIILPVELPAGQREAFLRLMSQLTKMMISEGGVVREVQESDLRGCQVTRESEKDRGMNVEQNGSKEDEEMPKRRTSDLVANGIQTTSELVARGLKWGAEKGSNLIKYGGERWRSRIEESQSTAPQREPQQPPVGRRVVEGARVARSGTHTVVETSAKAVGVVGSAAKGLAVWAAPHLRRGAQQILPSSWTSDDSTGRSKAQSAAVVASAAITGFGTVYEALEHSAKCVGRAAADGTSGVVKARYGNEAGRVASDVLYSVGNVGLTVHNVQNLGPKAVAKTVASHGAAAVASQDQRKKEGNEKRNLQ